MEKNVHENFEQRTNFLIKKKIYVFEQFCEKKKRTIIKKKKERKRTITFEKKKNTN